MKSKNRQVGLHQTKKLLHSKGNNQQIHSMQDLHGQESCLITAISQENPLIFKLLFIKGYTFPPVHFSET